MLLYWALLHLGGPGKRGQGEGRIDKGNSPFSCHVVFAFYLPSAQRRISKRLIFRKIIEMYPLLIGCSYFGRGGGGRGGAAFLLHCLPNAIRME